MSAGSRAWTLLRHEIGLRLADRASLTLAVAAPLGLAALVVFAFGSRSERSAGPALLVVSAVQQEVALTAASRLGSFLADGERTWVEIHTAPPAPGSAVPAAVLELADSECTGAAQLELGSTALRSQLLGQLVAEWWHLGCPSTRPGAETPFEVDRSGSRRAAGLALFIPSLGIFFLSFSLLDATRSLLEDERNGIVHRLLAAGVEPSWVVMSKMAGSWVAALVQFGLLVLIAAGLFGVSWGSSPLGIVLLVLGVAVAGSGLGLGLATLVRSPEQAAYWGGGLLVVLAVLGGTFAPGQQMSGWLGGLANLSYLRWASAGFEKLLVAGEGLAAVLPNVAALLSFGLFGLAVASFRFRRRFAA